LLPNASLVLEYLLGQVKILPKRLAENFIGEVPNEHSIRRIAEGLAIVSDLLVQAQERADQLVALGAKLFSTGFVAPSTFHSVNDAATVADEPDGRLKRSDGSLHARLVDEHDAVDRRRLVKRPICRFRKFATIENDQIRTSTPTRHLLSDEDCVRVRKDAFNFLTGVGVDPTVDIPLASVVLPQVEAEPRIVDQARNQSQHDVRKRDLDLGVDHHVYAGGQHYDADDGEGTDPACRALFATHDKLLPHRPLCPMKTKRV